MDRSAAVLAAAQRRAEALAAADERGLRELLHPSFVWTSHLGERFTVESYVRSNLRSGARWHSQSLADTQVVLVGAVAVLTCLVTDVIDRGEGAETFTMPMTQVWSEDSSGWRCVAGHAGPRIENA